MWHNVAYLAAALNSVPDSCLPVELPAVLGLLDVLEKAARRHEHLGAVLALEVAGRPTVAAVIAVFA